MYRNLISILIGLLTVTIKTIYFINIEKKWFKEIQSIPINKIKVIFFKAPNKFFFILIFLYFVSLITGSIITFFLVKNAKIAYSILVGYISFFLFLIYIIYYNFPIWFKIIFIPIHFMFPCLIGNFIEIFRKKL